MTTTADRAKHLFISALNQRGASIEALNDLLAGRALTQVADPDPLIESGIAAKVGNLTTAAVKMPAKPLSVLDGFSQAIHLDATDAALASHLAMKEPPAPLCILTERTTLPLAQKLRAHGHRVIDLQLGALSISATTQLAAALAQAEAERAILVIDQADELLAMELDEVELAQGHTWQVTKLNPTQSILHDIIAASFAALVLGVESGRELPPPCRKLITLKTTPHRSNYHSRLEETHLLAGELNAQLSPVQISSLARPDVSPAQRRNMIYATMLTGSTENALSLVPNQSSLSPEATDDFRLELVNCDRDIGAMIERLKGRPVNRLRFMLHGITGTGKSTLAAYIARQLGYEPRIVPASEIEHKGVGDTEKAIGAMFRNASANKEAIILDEAESLLMDRSLSTWNYDIQRTNTFLQWLSPHDQPFLITTNHADRIDPAIAKRLPLKFEIKPLRADQMAIAWSRTFHRKPPAGLADLKDLTPNDFLVDYEKADLFDYLADDRQILDDLMGEWVTRQPVSGFKNPVGFRPT